MMRRKAMGVLVWLALASAKAAEAQCQESDGASARCAWYDPSAPAPHVRLALDARFGVSTAPFYTEAFPEVRGHGFVGVLSGGYRLSAQHEVGLQLPAAAIEVRQPAGAYVNELVWGNPSLYSALERLRQLDSSTTLRYILRVDLGLPLSAHGPRGSLMSNRALAIANAVHGGRLPELYTPGRLSISPSAGVAFERARVGAEASLKLPLLFRVSRAAVPDSADTHVVGLVPVLHTSFRVRVASWFTPALHADIVLNAVPPFERARGRPQPAQLILEPALLFRLTRALGLTIAFMLPVGGALGGSTYAGSLRFAAAW